MKTMTPNFVTNSTFNKAMKNIDQEFVVVRRDIDDLRKMIRDTMEEQRVILYNDMTRYVGAVIEESKSQFKALYEHPVFTTYKA
jgi:Holliday junction resolvase RusA-like endonuclease